MTGRKRRRCKKFSNSKQNVAKKETLGIGTVCSVASNATGWPRWDSNPQSWTEADLKSAVFTSSTTGPLRGCLESWVVSRLKASPASERDEVGALTDNQGPISLRSLFGLSTLGACS